MTILHFNRYFRANYVDKLKQIIQGLVNLSVCLTSLGAARIPSPMVILPESLEISSIRDTSTRAAT